MYCHNCGSYVSDDSRYCDNCGAPQSGFSGSSRTRSKRNVNFMEAIQLYFTRYFDFSGRSRRSEYWYATLFISVAGGIIGSFLPELAGIWSLVVMIPSLALCIRRLHDVGKSAWWYLWVCVPLIGYVVLLVLFCQDSQAANKWGRSPKY